MTDLLNKIMQTLNKLIEKANKKETLIYIGAFCLLILGIIAAFADIPWYVLIPLELIFMALVCIGANKK